MNPIRPEYAVEIQGIRAVLLQVRGSLRTAASGMESIMPMLKTEESLESELRTIITDLNTYEKFIAHRYQDTYEA